MPEKTYELLIDNFQKGIGPSPHLGFGDMTNLDIFSVPGIVRINNSTANVTSTTGTTLWMAKNPNLASEFFALDANGQLYTSIDYGDTWATVAGETMTAGFGHGMVIWKDYVIVARNTLLDIYGPLSGVRAWTNGWKTIDSDTDWHMMYISKSDGKVYGGAGQYIFSIEENSGFTFAPGTAATFTWTAQTLDLPDNYRVKPLAELGNNLMIGTWQGVSIYDQAVADIFPWDRSSVSFDLPLSLNEHGVNAMININNILYIQAGIEGKIFSSNGVQSARIAQIPLSISNIDGGAFMTPYPGSMINYKGRPFFGLGEVWSLSPSTDGNILTHEHTTSAGYSGSLDTKGIGSLIAVTRDTLLIGWKDGITYGIDKTQNSKRYGSYTAYFDSALFKVGTLLAPRQFTQIEFQLAKELVANQGVRLQYRVNLTDSFTTIGTYDYTTLGGVISHNAVADIPACEFLQIRCLLTANATENFTPELRLIILR